MPGEEVPEELRPRVMGGNGGRGVPGDERGGGTPKRGVGRVGEFDQGGRGVRRRVPDDDKFLGG